MFSTDSFMDGHASAVSSISEQVKSFHAKKAPFRIYHGSTNSTRASSRTTSTTVDCSTLNHVLRVDRDSKTAWVEPNIAMDQLVDATLKEGLLPKVVMEFPGITVGGGWNGTSGESSSFRHGYFDNTVTKLEIVLPNGKVVVATRENEYADLYNGSSSAVGTLGVTTLVELQLVEAKKYVELTYHPIKSMDEGVAKIKETIVDRSVEYCDGILFSKDEGAICTGRLTDEPSNPETPVQRFSRAHDQWFYIQAQKNVQSNPDPAKPKVELVPVVDYFFRYNRGGFWVGTLAFRWFKLPFNRWNRWLLNYFMITRNMYHALHASGHDNLYIIQDVAVPLSASTKFVDEYIEKDFKQYPIWLCPLLQAPKSSPFSPRIMAPPADPADVDTSEVGGDPSKMMLSFGVWGAGPLLQGGTHEAFVSANRLLEEKVHALGGKKWLYAHTYYTESEFWKVYDKPAYDRLREKYDAGHLLDVYQKVRVKESWREVQRRESEEWGAYLRGKFWRIWPMSGVYGVFSLVFGKRDYLRRGAEKVRAVTEGKKEA